MIKLLMGGSPCTYWSIAKRYGRETEPYGKGWELFRNFLIAKEKFKPDFFLYENNCSVADAIKNRIRQELGTAEYIEINSALVSAQQRKRFYVHNCGAVNQPDDRKIMLKDVLESGLAWQEKSYCLTASYQGAVFFNTLERRQRTMIAEPIGVNYLNGKSKYSKTDFVNAMRTDGFGTAMVAAPVRIGHFGKGGQSQRIYSVHGKSVALSANGGGQGGKTGLYKIDLPDGDYIIRKLTPTEAERLQTLPDNYTAGISNTQRYRCLGNGWTAEVIIHILKSAFENVPKNEKILVLSMYDGIATGRYCLDRMGFKNVEYHAFETDKYALKTAMKNYPDIIQHGDAFNVRNEAVLW